MTSVQLQRVGMAGYSTGMTQLNDRSSLLHFLKSRKSASAKAMAGPGPTPAQVDEMIAIASRIPDHGKLTPWRFVIFEDEARGRVGEHFAKRWAALNPGHGPDSLAFQRGLFERAPVVIAVLSTAAQHVKIPIWEQHLSAGAVCYNLVLSAQALGFDAQWQTDWVAYDAETKAAIGCAAHENVAGLIYVGTTTAALEDRPRPDLSLIAKRWGA
jgi:nitroreductase